MLNSIPKKLQLRYVEQDEQVKQLEKEADWLADGLAVRMCPHDCDDREAATMPERCTKCWREAAHKVVEEQCKNK